MVLPAEAHPIRVPSGPRILPRAALPVAVLLCAAGPSLAPAASRPPERFQREVVVSVEALASASGLSTLERGGNAADAAIATALALAVVHPQAGNLAGGSFTVWRDHEGSCEVIDGREVAPAAARADMFLDTDGHPIPGASTRSPLAVAVPGTLPALGLLHARHGRLPWGDLVEPAVRLARRGFPVSARLARDLRIYRERLEPDPAAAAIFYPGGRALAEGERLIQRDLADTLTEIRDRGARAFGTGRLAARLADDLERRGAMVRAADLAAYEALVRRPLLASYRGHDLCLPPLPAAGGLTVAQVLGMLEEFPIGPDDRSGSRFFHLLAEALRRAFADRRRFFGDPSFIAVPVAELTAKFRLRSWADSIDPEHATPSATLFDDAKAPVAAPGAGPSGREGRESQTTHFSVVDPLGNAVAQTTTLNSLFGAGLMASGTGVLWNDEMDDFTTLPLPQAGASAEGTDLVGAPNGIAPGKRPLSSMCPVVVSRQGRLEYVLGSPGGLTIPSTVIQVLVNLFDLGLDPQEAVDAPRVHHQGLPDEIVHESDAFAPDVREALVRRGHSVRARFDPEPSQGDVHLIAVRPEGGLLAAPDPRRGGAARGH